MQSSTSALEPAPPLSRTQGERSKHHYVPVFYLQSWAGEDGKLCQFSRPRNTPPGEPEPDPKIFPVKALRRHPNAVGYIKDLYRFPDLNARLTNYLENEFFLRVDNDAAAVMHALLRGETRFDIHAKSAWARFLMSMFHRSPENIGRITEMLNLDYIRRMEDDLRPGYEEQREQHGGGPTWDEMIENLSDADYQQFRLLTLSRVINSDRVGSLLTNMIWTVAPRYGNYPLFTSDRPITMTTLGQENAHIVMPLTPDHIFFAARNAGTLHRIEQRNLYGGLAEIVNDNVVRQARTYAYAIDDSRHAFLANRLGERRHWGPLE